MPIASGTWMFWVKYSSNRLGNIYYELIILNTLITEVFKLMLFCSTLPTFLRAVRSVLKARRTKFMDGYVDELDKLTDLAQWQLRVIAFLVFIAIVVIFTIVPVAAMKNVWSIPIIALVIIVKAAILQLIACLLAGLFHFETTAERAIRKADEVRLNTWRSSSSEYERSEDEEWQEEVHRLSTQGFTLECLLHFYKVTLREHMPHFDPNLHKTVDVVRGAIIPESAEDACALAVQLMEGRPTRPDVMVTHNWSNLFRDLIAAILADALDDTCFDFIAYLLDHDKISDIELLLLPAHRKRTYWVCAFSVNQHISICHANPFSTRDSVTQQLHVTCKCSANKYDNATPPLRRRDSKSIKCQMNKFDDMIALLSSENSEFRQVVAVDCAFALFSRAWCVAELAMAHKMGMPQALKFVSIHALEEASLTKLRNLRIQDMQAARPEDVDEILSKIPDVDAFNGKLHELLFSRNGLLAQMANFDVAAMLRRLSIIMQLHMVVIQLTVVEKALESWSTSFQTAGRFADDVMNTVARSRTSESTEHAVQDGKRQIEVKVAPAGGNGSGGDSIHHDTIDGGPGSLDSCRHGEGEGARPGTEDAPCKTRMADSGPGPAADVVSRCEDTSIECMQQASGRSVTTTGASDFKLISL
eukprot:TRINITY_DN13799_c0_g1_i3.p1 TRINITY_DN13799_c0_g1~~TRINITY_DN13799_c0_g1_i3.p1  ORF type:complete len:644 (+),score=89.54 TRINITY_DN13799_c0_g1_i3:107-2038(+)